jgi:hypothetical protein
MSRGVKQRQPVERKKKRGDERADKWGPPPEND